MTRPIQFAIVLVMAGSLCAVAEEPFALPDRGVVPAQVLRKDDQGVTFQIRGGVVTYDWWELDLHTADRVGRKAGEFKILDSRSMHTDAFDLTRAIVSRTFANGVTRFYTASRYMTPQFSSHSRDWNGSVDAPPQFIDINTVLVIPNHLLLAYRDFDGDLNFERFTISRPVTIIGNKVVDDDPDGEHLHRWRTSIEIDYQIHTFDFLSRTLPSPPEPSPDRPGHIVWGSKEYALADLRFDSRDTEFFSKNIKVLKNPETDKENAEPANRSDSD